MYKKNHSLFLSLAFVLGLNFVHAVESHVHPPGMLGVALHEIFPEEVGRFSLPGEYGALVEAVQPGSPAETAGLRVDDVITAYNGVNVESARALRRMVLESPAGRTVELRVIREGAALLLPVTLGEGQDPVSGVAAPPRAPRRLGVGVEPVSPQLADVFSLEEGQGLFVAQVQEDSVAERAGIQARDLLVSVENQVITSPEALSEMLNRLPGSEAVVTLIRNGARQNVTLRF